MHGVGGKENKCQIFYLLEYRKPDKMEPYEADIFSPIKFFIQSSFKKLNAVKEMFKLK